MPPTELALRVVPYDDVVIADDLVARRVVMQRRTWDALVEAASARPDGVTGADVARAILELWPVLADRIERRFHVLVDSHDGEDRWTGGEVMMLVRIVADELRQVA